MSVFNELRNSQKSGMPDMNEMQKYAGQLRSNPVGFLRNLGFNVPENMDLSNPNAIIGHLMQSNQISGGLLGKAQQIMSMFR